MSFCVNTNSPIFKEVAKRLDIAEGQLVNITHEYANFEGGKNDFPSDEYIKSKTEGKENLNASEDAAIVWDAKYSSPQLFSNRAKFEEAKEEAIKLFGESAIGERITNDGKFSLTVAQQFNEKVYQRELDTIEERAKANGTFMKAPNGKDSNLNRQQWLQVRTKAFKRWFGDWENDPENASKVVDENGEPLVVYHGSPSATIDKFTNKNKRYSVHSNGLFFSESKESADTYAYGDTPKVYGVFLNIKNLEETRYTDEDTIESLRERENAAINNPSNDGVKMLTYDKLGPEVQYVAKYPNQVKSAERNVGSFSNETGSIYNNISNVNVLRALQTRLDIASQLSDEIIKVGNKYHIRAPFRGKGYTEKYLRERATEKAQNILSKYGIPAEAVEVEKVGIGSKHTWGIRLVGSNLIDEIKRNESTYHPTSFDELSDEHKYLLNYLSNKTGLKYIFVSEQEAKDILLKVGNRYTGQNAFVLEDTAYFISGKEFSTDILSEEMLHPFVASIAKVNPEAFKSLYEEAKTAFPKLEQEIYSAYASNREEELVTQALSRAFRQDYEENPNHRSVLELLIKFWEAIKGWFKRNEHDLPVANIEDFRITADDLSPEISIKNLAQIINTEVALLGANNINRVASNQITETLEVSTAGDEFGRQFSAFNAKFKEGTIIDGVDVSGRSIEDVYQNVIKKSGKGRAPAETSKLYNPELKTREEQEEFSYQEGYFPLWQEWAKQNPELIEQLRERAEDKTLTDKFATSRVSQARALTEILEKTVPEQSKAKSFDQIYEEKSQAITTQISNLLDSSAVTMTEVREESRKLVDWISDQLTQYQENPEIVFDKCFKDKNYTEEQKKELLERIPKMSRRELLDLIKIDRMLDFYKYEVLSLGKKRFSLRNKFSLIENNIDALLDLGYSRFVQREGFGVVLSDVEGTMHTTAELRTPEERVTPDDYNSDESTNGYSEEDGNQQDHWQIESRTRAILDDASELVKQALDGCFILIDNGKKNPDGTPDYDIKKDTIGRNERIDRKDAVRSIVKWTQGALTLQGMIDNLLNKEKDNPWVSQIISKLQDISGKEAQFQSQFFTTFMKHFQPYSIVLKNQRGDYYVMEANSHPALRDAMRSIEVQYKLGKSPLFNNVGVDQRGVSELTAINEKLSKLTTSPETIEEAVNLIGQVLTYIGLPQPRENITRVLNNQFIKDTTNNVSRLLSNLRSEIGNSLYDPFQYNGEHNIKKSVQDIVQPFTDLLEDVMVSSVYDSGKMYQSYITPSYTTKLFQKMHLPDAEFFEFLKNEFATTEWFYTGKDFSEEELRKASNWRMPWMKDVVRMDEKTRQEAFIHRVQLNFDSKNYMKDMTDGEYALSVITEYFLDPSRKNTTGVGYAYYRFPMISNKPSSEFIRFKRYTKAEIIDGFMDIFNQELARIQSLEILGINKGEEGYITNFNERGKHFLFLDYLDEYLHGNKKSDTLGQLLRDKIAGKKIDEASLLKLVRDEITDHLNQVATNLVAEYRKNGIFDAMKKIDTLNKSDENILRAIREFSYNDMFANANILQLLITDKAFYKDEEDVQKRLAQVHSPGRRGNPDATDFNGNRVSDGKIRAVKIADYKGIISSTIENVTEVFDRRIENAPVEEKRGWEAIKQSVIDALHDINVVDGQAFSSPTGFRKKGFMFGEWTREDEKVYQDLLKGKANLAQMRSVFNPKKPFTYSRIPTKLGENSGAPITSFFRPVQFKDSEYLLIMADALLRGSETSRPNLLKALYDVMENSASSKDFLKDNKDQSAIESMKRGIDFVVFDSGVKSGLIGAININKLVDNPNGEDLVYSQIWGAIHNADGTYNTNFVDEIDAEDYTQQQNVPEHFMNHADVQWGSQIRVIMPSDLETTYLGQPVRYEFFDPATNEWKSLDKDEIRAEWEKTTAEMIRTSIDNLCEEFGLNSDFFFGDGTSKLPSNLSKRDRNLLISKILQREILTNERYGVDLLLACSVDKNGEFRIPLGDPIQAKRVEQLINSVIKNRVNRQKVEGGTLVEVTNFGATRMLERRYKGKDGKVLKAKREYLAEGHTEAEFEKYLHENQNGIAYDECYAPAWMGEIYRKFVDKDGNVDVEGLEFIDEDLLKMYGFRIPTEEKYSTAPYKIVGFLPKEAGDGFMQPWDTTVTDGSDFDVDKKNIMRKVLKLKQKMKGMPKISDLYEQASNKLNLSKSSEKEAILQEILNRVEGDKNYIKQNSSEISAENGEREVFLAVKEAYYKAKYKVEKPTKGRDYLNNKIFDMQWAIATHASTADKMLNPGNFDPQKRMGYMVSAYKLGGHTWEELQSMSIDALKGLVAQKKNLMEFSVQTQYYRQNSVAGQILGIFAVARSAHAMFEGRDYFVEPASQFTIAGKHFGDKMEVDRMYDDSKVNLIGKTLGSLVGASADAVKDPVLNLMNITKETVNVLTGAIRLGMKFDDIALLLSSKAITDALNTYRKEKLTKYSSLDNVINARLEELKNEDTIKGATTIYNEELTSDELVAGLLEGGERAKEIEFKILLAYQRLSEVAEKIQPLTNLSRLNSVKSAVGPQIINTITQKEKLDASMEVYKRTVVYKDAAGSIYKIGDTLSDGTVLTKENLQKLVNDGTIKVQKSYDPASQMTVFNDIPSIDAFYKGYTIADTIMKYLKMPAASNSFAEVLDALDDITATGNLRYKVLSDDKLLGSLSDFFQSYLLVQSGAVDETQLKYYTQDFAREFIEKDYKSKYKGNPLIDAIHYSVSKDSAGRQSYVLKLETTGMEQSEKDAFSAGWVQLERENPELSHKLFYYNFFRTGIGFNPKSFMGLVPIQVKENIPGYIDTYRSIPSVSKQSVVDMWIRNNWNNAKIVPIAKLPTGTTVSKDGSFKVTSDSYGDYLGKRFVRIRINGVDRLFQRERDNSVLREATYREITPLGNNGAYLEISTKSEYKAIEVPNQAISGLPVDGFGNNEAPARREISATRDRDVNRLVKYLNSVISPERMKELKQDKAELKKIVSTTADELHLTIDNSKFDDIVEMFC